MKQVELPLGASDGARVLAPGAFLLRGFAGERAPALLRDVGWVVERAPFRHLRTPQGHRMSVAMTNCGELGWFSDERGYRYTRDDPESGRPWPPMPPSFRTLAVAGARAAGFDDFAPQACLVNLYEPGARLTLHQDKDELQLAAPIVSVSLGLPATFLLGGMTRAERPRRIGLEHGDVVVWGGPSRLRYHGVAPLRDGVHPLVGPRRINLTFRVWGDAS